MRDRLLAISAVLNRAGAVGAALALAALIVLITLQVLRRRLFDAPIVFTDEAGGYLLVAITFLGLGYALEQGDHIQITLLTSHFRPGTLWWVRVGWALIGLGFTGLLTVRMAQLALDSARLGTFSIVSRIPIAPIQAIAPVGFALLFVALLAQLLDALRPPR